MSLLKVSPYDPPTMGCRGLQKYMVEVFPYGEWTHEGSRTTLTAFLRRLDKTFVKICKKPSIRVRYTLQNCTKFAFELGFKVILFTLITASYRLGGCCRTS